MKIEKNPFDAKGELSCNSIRFLVYSIVEKDELLKKESDLKKLCRLSGFKEIDIEFIENSEKNFLINKKFDWIIDDSENENFFKIKTTTISSKEAFEIARLFLIYNGCFYVNEHHKYDETGYYLFRYRKLFYSYDAISKLIISEKIECDEWLDSLSTRLELLTRAFDQTKIECYKTPNNTTMSHILYHFGYMVILMTGVLDNIAWLINFDNDLDLNKMKITLRLKINLENLKTRILSDFVKALKRKPNKEKLYNSIENLENQSFLDVIYFFRDNLVHRKYFSGIEIAGGRNGNIVEISEEGMDILKNYLKNEQDMERCTIILPNKTFFIDPLHLIEKFEKDYVDLINRLLLDMRSDVQFENSNLYNSELYY